MTERPSPFTAGFSEAAAARDRLEADINYGSGFNNADITNDIALVCAWTRHWEHACTELDEAANEIDRLISRLNWHIDRHDYIADNMWSAYGKGEFDGLSERFESEEGREPKEARK